MDTAVDVKLQSSSVMLFSVHRRIWQARQVRLARWGHVSLWASLRSKHLCHLMFEEMVIDLFLGTQIFEAKLQSEQWGPVLPQVTCAQPSVSWPRLLIPLVLGVHVAMAGHGWFS